MKKLQLKIPANKKRLQINRAPHPSPPVFEPKIEVLKQNFNNLGQLQQKEEKPTKGHQLPSIHPPTSNRRASKSAINESHFLNDRSNGLSIHSSKNRFIRRSISIEFSKPSQLIQIQSPMLNLAIRNFLDICERKKILRHNLSDLSISSQNLQAILRLIISKKYYNQKNDFSFQNCLVEEDTLDRIISKKRGGASIFYNYSKSHCKKMTICSMEVEETVIGLENSSQVNQALRKEGKALKEETQWLRRMKKELGDQIEERQKVMHETERQILNIEFQLSHSTAELNSLNLKIEQNRQLFAKIQSKKSEIQNFIQCQSNKIVKQAAQYHKNLEIDLFEFADYLRHHPLGKKGYQTSIYYNEIERLMEDELKQLTTFLIEEKREGAEKKGRMMASFLEKMQHQYQLMINELQHVIEEKTKSIQKYCSIVYLWYENYLTKKEYLDNLTEGFSLEVVKVEESRKEICRFGEEEVEKCSYCALVKRETMRLLTSFQKIIQIYSMGNSFY